MNLPTRACLAVAAGLAFFTSLASAAETREATGFTVVAVSAPILVMVDLGERESLTLEGNEAALARIETTVDKGVLRIRLKERALSFNHRVIARVTARHIKALSVAGSGDIHARQLRGDSLRIEVAGSGDVIVEGGKVGALKLDIAGSGDVRAPKLEAQHVTISIAGSGDALVWARASLKVNVVGSGDVRYYGDAAVSKSIVGSGDIRRLAAEPS